ncbi:MAG TPA: thiamine pyrophosphate-dependent dehydrogenase E1 component subunit alpha [Candidatus Dormibacteraeota bacterium]|nr:thiamine pyrophosphate-dependent dehydrogenase E1 component subunit alpha [Candidatus Dormibacteraeota bacterium]
MIGALNVSAAVALECLDRMVVIRAVEEGICAEYSHRNIRGPVHLSIGQEAMAVGVLNVCRPEDVAVSTHRDHAHYLAKGGDVGAMIDELYGLETGCSHGYGGSMHLFSREANFMGASAVLPGSTPVAVGLGLGCKLDGRGAVAVGFSGDGAADEGSFFEALNLAAVLKLPVLFVCENNGLSTNTPLAARQAQTDISAKARAFGLVAETAEGVDVFAVRDAAAGLFDRIRTTSEPAVLALSADRLCAHVGPVSKVAALNPQTLLDEAADQGTRDPIAYCVGVILRELPELRGDCIDILREVPLKVAAEFQRADAAFEDRNKTAGLVAPPPPKVHTV